MYFNNITSYIAPMQYKFEVNKVSEFSQDIPVHKFDNMGSNKEAYNI